MLQAVRLQACLLVGMLSPGILVGQVSSAPQSDDYPTEEVSFPHADHVLSGTLYLPDRAGPHPAIVLLAGSGPADRTSGGYFPYLQPHLLEAGFAVLVYDKPGVGLSTGDWRTMTLRDRSEEAITAVQHLTSRDDICADRVGLWGGSQGGWVAPLAATLSRDVAFVITISAPGVTPAEQDVYGLENHVREGGHSEADVRRGVLWGEGLMKEAARGASYDEVRRTFLEPAEGKPWGEYFVIPDAETWEFLAATDPRTGQPNVLYDPVPVLERLRTPYLGIFGEDDNLVPVSRSVDLTRRALETAGNADFKIVVFPDANHGIMVGPRIFAPGYFDLMAEWLRERDPTSCKSGEDGLPDS